MSVSFRFIHAADLHLDSPFRGLAKAPGQVRERLADSTFDALRRLTDAAVTEKVDFVVLSGDLFDAADLSLRAQLLLVREWEKLEAHGISVFAIHGNHDPLDGARADLKLPGNVHVFGAEGMDYRPAYRRSGELAAFVYGRSYGTKVVTDNMAAGYRPQPEGPFHIAMLHGNVDGDGTHDPYAPCSLADLTGNGFDYWALGHIHGRRVLHEYPHVVYAGNAQGRNPREIGAKGCYLVDVSASRSVTLTFVPLDSVRWIEQTHPIGEAESEQELLRQLSAEADRLAAEADGRSVMIRFRLTGRGALHRQLAEPAVRLALLEQLQTEPPEREPWAFVHELVADTEPAIPWEALAAEDSFAGELYRLSGRLMDNEALWSEFAKEAVAPLAGHAGLGRLLREELEERPARWLAQARELTLGLIGRDEE
ncbi:metallophosphoesterase family protein [Paenibacillus arenilitoris]|uniref:DNA repair exonuclease n=1 Tax=Paenibacillus arenilitoris TaxID=2772299 RepID=A0A927CSQ1_9BACL|nr:DNA repair exonuclease [Paenibacillus arenilitoris]MBD2872745.1 DNA repair exonuclease [Paenibacillus arenilitoris]